VLDAAGSGSWRQGALDAVGSSAKAKAALGVAHVAAWCEARVIVEKRRKQYGCTVFGGGSCWRS
jgi:hypothetical protein